jgi:phage terminase large subunit-like protein
VPFSQQHADAACNFFEGVLKHTADEWWGQPFLLCPWEEEALCAIFGNLDDEGNRVIELVYLEVPKKAGKTEFVAGIVLLVLVLTSTPGCQVYGAASATRQALNVYRAACKMVEQSAILKKHLRIMRGTNRIVKRSDPDSFYAAVAADGDFGDGVNPAFTVADEVHRWKTRKQLENWDVLSKGGITRKQTLTIAITTAGVQDESPLAWRLHEKTRRINEGIVSDARFYGRIYGAEKTDDPSLPATWIKANPSLLERGGFLHQDKIRKEYESAVAEGDLTSFKRYFLNIWDQKENRAIDMVQWDAAAGDWHAAGLLPNPGPALIRGRLIEAPPVRPLPNELMERFIGRRCWAGVDLSMTTDTTSVAFVFPCEGEDEYDVLAVLLATRREDPQDGNQAQRAIAAVGARRLPGAFAWRSDRLPRSQSAAGVGRPDVRPPRDLLGSGELATDQRTDGRGRVYLLRSSAGIRHSQRADEEDPGSRGAAAVSPRRAPGPTLAGRLRVHHDAGIDRKHHVREAGSGYERGPH